MEPLIGDLAVPDTAVAATDVPRTWVLPEHKIVYVSIAKNACTSIKWLLAEISGQDIQRFFDHPSAEASRRMLVHNRRRWQRTPPLRRLSVDARRDISPSNGWFVFSVVRDPRLRLFSAWQSKFLVGDPIYSHRKYARQPWLPRIPENAEQVLQDWERFLTVLEAGDGPAEDWHFEAQTRQLSEDVVPYSRVYEITELSQLSGDLSEHLGTVTGSAPELSLSRENDTPLRAGREVFDHGIAERIENLYEADFARFGSLWSLDAVRSRPIDWGPDAYTNIAVRRAANERIADLHRMVRRSNREAADLRAELERTRAARSEAENGRTGAEEAPDPAPAGTAADRAQQGRVDRDASDGSRGATSAQVRRRLRSVRRAVGRRMER